MFLRAAQYLTARLVDNGTIPREKAALYSFGFHQGMRTLAEALLLLVSAFILGLLWPCAVILVAFVPVRIYAGGYHAPTAGECAWKTWVFLVGALLYLKYVPGYLFLQIAVLMTVAVMIGLAAPIQDENKPLEQFEIRKYRKKAAIFYSVDLAVFAIGHMISFPILSRCISLSMAMLLVIMAAGIAKNKKRTGKK